MIVIESPDILSECISELRRQILGEDGQFVLSDKDICKIDKKMELIVDPWTIDLDSKRIKTKLLQLIKEESDEYFYDQFIETKGRMYQYAENILEKISYPILYNISIDNMALIKMLDFKIDIQTEKLADYVIEYIKLIHDLCKIEVIVLVNIKSYLSKEDLFYLYKESMYQKIHLLLLESRLTEQIEYEKIIIIDADKCVINI